MGLFSFIKNAGAKVSGIGKTTEEEAAEATMEAVEKAKGWANLNFNAEKVGPALRRLSETDSELAKSIEEVLSSTTED